MTAKLFAAGVLAGLLVIAVIPSAPADPEVYVRPPPIPDDVGNLAEQVIGEVDALLEIVQDVVSGIAIQPGATIQPVSAPSVPGIGGIPVAPVASVGGVTLRLPTGEQIVGLSVGGPEENPQCGLWTTALGPGSCIDNPLVPDVKLLPATVPVPSPAGTFDVVCLRQATIVADVNHDGVPEASSSNGLTVTFPPC